MANSTKSRKRLLIATLVVMALMGALAGVISHRRPQWDARAVGLWLEGTRRLEIRSDGKGAFLAPGPSGGLKVSTHFVWWTSGDRLFMDTLGDGRRSELHHLALMISGRTNPRIYRIADGKLIPEKRADITLLRVPKHARTATE